MKIKAVLIDMDGTLVNTESIWNKSIIYANNFFKVSVPLDFYIKYAGTTMEAKLEPLKEYLQGKVDARQYIEFQRKWKTNYIEQNGLEVRSKFDDLCKFANDNDIKLVLVSSSKRENILFNLKYANIDKCIFDFIVSSDDVTFVKPNAEPYLKAMARLHLSCNDCIAVEDTSIGIKSALNAGLKVVLARQDYLTYEDLKLNVFGSITDFNELINLIKSCK